MPANRVPLWLPAISLALCAVGLAAAGYLTYEHFSASVTLACPDTGHINCLKVTTSTYSRIVGIPVALLGLLYFVVATPLCLPVAWRSPYAAVRWLRLGGATIGVAFVVYLVWAELYRIDAICLYCTAVHVTTVLLFIVIALGTALTAPLPQTTE